MALRDRLLRLKAKAEQGGVLIYQRDGSVRVFEVMEVQAQMFLAQCDLWKDTATDSEVVRAVRSATPESRREFENRFGSIVMTNYVIGSVERGGWVEAKTLTEDGRVERVRYEGGSPEATIVREAVQTGSLTSELHEELPRPPVAGRWMYGVDDEDLSE